MNESKPDYELFKDGIEHLESKVGMLARFFRCPVLLALLVATVAGMYFQVNSWLIAFFGVLIFLWGAARYLIWPREISEGKKKSG